MAEHAGVVRRREDPRLITGAGEFVDDLRDRGYAALTGCHLHVEKK